MKSRTKLDEGRVTLRSTARKFSLSERCRVLLLVSRCFCERNNILALSSIPFHDDTVKKCRYLLGGTVATHLAHNEGLFEIQEGIHSFLRISG